MQTKTELTLEQTQQGVSDEVLVIPMVAAAGPRQVRFIATCSYSTDISKATMKAQMTIQAVKMKKKYEHVGLKVTSTQEGKISQDDDMRLYSADDLKKLKDHMQVKLEVTSTSLKSKDHYTYHKMKDKESRPRAKTKGIHRMLSLRFL
ncbi:hypothetical protein Tco_0291892 [Tanacetum coccineum]